MYGAHPWDNRSFDATGKDLTTTVHALISTGTHLYCRRGDAVSHPARRDDAPEDEDAGKHHVAGRFLSFFLSFFLVFLEQRSSLASANEPDRLLWPSTKGQP